jgi:ABC-type amino acid transport substrate-binding protein
VPVTTATRFGALQSGEVDLLIATVTATDQRRSQAELSDPYFMTASLMLVRQGSPLERLGDAAGRRIAVVKGSVQASDVAELQPHAVVVPVASVEEGARAVERREVDALVYDDVVLLTLAQHNPGLRVTGWPIRPRPYVAVARKGDTALIRWVNGWLARMRRDGSYDAMWHKYFGPFESRLVAG